MHSIITRSPNGEDTIQFAPTHYVDIGETQAIKKAACYAHASQTPDRYYALQDQVAAFRGLKVAVREPRPSCCNCKVRAIHCSYLLTVRTKANAAP